ncbi:OmpA family protein [Ilyomonas limi]|uniref:OmpA family protein n=1 Tax=Ilyomonas limi TaxID=2575867 RepID=A0A4U3KTR2_9BACT|nr:OmpA family protein [Ilyomonas limi]TKK65712.1 OmpA family protein [Ilyomonas limi]
MKRIQSYFLVVATAVLMLNTSCSNMNKSQKGAVIGAGGGAVVGGAIGKATGNTALGAIIGAAVGGTAGAVIGKKMDKQAEEIKKTVPSAKVERVGEGITVEFSNNVMFAFNSYALTPTADSTLEQLITILNKYPNTNIEVQGHTDSTGTHEYNQTLSESRAHAAAQYLRDHGIADSRITEKGYGETAPKYPNATAEGRAQNRRVEFVISANEQMKNEAQQESNQNDGTQQQLRRGKKNRNQNQ